jgi:WD40 repeat protein
VRELGRTRTACQRLAWLDGGRKLVAITQLHSFVTFDVASGAQLNAASVPGHGGTMMPGVQTLFLAVHPDGTRLATADDHDPRCRPPSPAQIWALTATGLTPTALPLKANLHGGLCFTPDGTALVGGAACRAVGSKEFVGEIVWWDLARGQAGKGFPGHAGLAASLAFTADGVHLVSHGGDGYFRVWDVATRQEVASRKGRNRHRALALAPDGRGLAFAHDYSGGLMLLDPLANKKLGKPHEIKAHNGQVAGVAYSPTNERIASVGSDRRLCLWTRTGESVRAFDTANWLTCVSFAPDGQTVAAGDERGGIYIYDVD